MPGEVRPYVPTGGTVIRSGLTTIAGGIVNATSAYGLTQPDFASSLTPAEGGTGTNNNDRLTTTFGANYNASTRVLTLPTNSKWTTNTANPFPEGTFNLCGLSMASGVEGKMATSTAKATFYLDSPLRPGSGCAPGTGTATMTNAKLNNGLSDRNIWFWVYGTVAPTDPPTPLPAGTNDIQMLDGSHIDGVWYAPYSRFYANNNVTVHGGVAAREVLMTNDVNAGFDVAVAQEIGPGAGPITRRGWFECEAVAPVVADPESGC